MPLTNIPFPDYRIPILDNPPNAGSYHDIRFDLNDPRAHEPLVRLEDYGIACENYYARSDAGNWPYNCQIEGATQRVWGRRTIAEKLAKVGQCLQPEGLRIIVLDAYRSIACQRGLWNFFAKQARRDLPDATEEERRQYTLNIVSDPNRFNRNAPTTWPVHACGGAVDVTLENISSGQKLDMGGRFDELSPVVYSDFYERQRKAGTIPADHPALTNRRLLHAAMAHEGFVNYPLEYWHFDYGDQMHILHAQRLGLKDAPKAAWYGYAECPEPL